MRRILDSRITILLLGLLLGMTVAIGVAVAQDHDTIQACANDKWGNLRLVESPDDCNKFESPVAWSITGPEGPQGPEGPEGPPGDTSALEARIAALESRTPVIDDFNTGTVNLTEATPEPVPVTAAVTGGLRYLSQDWSEAFPGSITLNQGDGFMDVVLGENIDGGGVFGAASIAYGGSQPDQDSSLDFNVFTTGVDDADRFRLTLSEAPPTGLFVIAVVGTGCASECAVDGVQSAITGPGAYDFLFSEFGSTIDLFDVDFLAVAVVASPGDVFRFDDLRIVDGS